MPPPLPTAAAAAAAVLAQPVSKPAARFLEPEQPAQARPSDAPAQQAAGDTPTGQAQPQQHPPAGLGQSAAAAALPMDIDVGQAASGSAASAAAPPAALWARYQALQALQAPFGQAPARSRPDELVVAPEFIPGGRHPGYKLFVGDLPPSTDDKVFRQWLRTDPDMEAALPVILDSAVSGGARSGLKKAIITFSSPDSLLLAHKAIWRWWAPCDPSIEPKGWRFFGVRVMTRK